MDDFIDCKLIPDEKKGDNNAKGDTYAHKRRVSYYIARNIVYLKRRCRIYLEYLKSIYIRNRIYIDETKRDVAF